MEKCIVTLTAEEVERLHSLVGKGQACCAKSHQRIDPAQLRPVTGQGRQAHSQEIARVLQGERVRDGPGQAAVRGGWAEGGSERPAQPARIRQPLKASAAFVANMERVAALTARFKG